MSLQCFNKKRDLCMMIVHNTSLRNMQITKRETQHRGNNLILNGKSCVHEATHCNIVTQLRFFKDILLMRINTFPVLVFSLFLLKKTWRILALVDIEAYSVWSSERNTTPLLHGIILQGLTLGQMLKHRYNAIRAIE